MKDTCVRHLGGTSVGPPIFGARTTFGLLERIRASSQEADRLWVRSGNAEQKHGERRLLVPVEGLDRAEPRRC
jgi:hypothetical protein